MSLLDPTRVAAQAVLQRARQQLGGDAAMAVIHLGTAHAVVVWGSAPDQSGVLALGLHSLAAAMNPGGHLSAGAVEEAIATVEDEVMPWRGRLPHAARLVSGDAWTLALASWAGMPADASMWWMSTDAVERLFDRWAALLQGRPASQDGLPSTGNVASALLVLREWLHHVGFDGIWVLGSESAP